MLSCFVKWSPNGVLHFPLKWIYQTKNLVFFLLLDSSQVMWFSREGNMADSIDTNACFSFNIIPKRFIKCVTRLMNMKMTSEVWNVCVPKTSRYSKGSTLALSHHRHWMAVSFYLLVLAPCSWIMLVLVIPKKRTTKPNNIDEIETFHEM